MPVDIGDRAPDFELPSTQGRTIKLSDLLDKGPVVLAFFPLAWSPVCTEEMCTIRDSMDGLSRLDAQVYGISVDSSFSQKAWADHLGLTFPLLSDFNKEVCRAYDVLHEEILGLKGIAKRSVFLIDKGGTVRYRWVTEDPLKKPEIREIEKAIDAMQSP